MKQETVNKIKNVIPYLNEHQWRVYLAAEADALKRGGITAISEFTGVHRNIISAGLTAYMRGVAR